MYWQQKWLGTPRPEVANLKQLGQILGIQVLTGQKSAQKRFAGPIKDYFITIVKGKVYKL